MLTVGDTEYFAARERAERELAAQASSATVRDIHLTLAEQYAARAVREAESAESENDLSGQAQDAG